MMRTTRFNALATLCLSFLLLATLSPRVAVAETSPIAIRLPPPVNYPAISKFQGEEGTVEVKVTVGVDGHPQKVVVTRSSGYPQLDKAAREAYMRAFFKPYIEDGVPIVVATLGTVRFLLQDDMRAALVSHLPPAVLRCGAASFEIRRQQGGALPDDSRYEIHGTRFIGTDDASLVYGTPDSAFLLAACMHIEENKPMLVFQVGCRFDSCPPDNFGIVDPSTMKLVLVPGAPNTSNAEQARKMLGVSVISLSRYAICCTDERRRPAARSKKDPAP